MEPTIDISVIVPVYKVEDYLDQCIRSILGQSFSNIEIILVDDGSPDKCPQMCDCYADNNPHVRVIHRQNDGLSSARNAGLDAALGKYVMFVDSDDWIAHDMCEKLFTIAETNSADMVICAIQNYNDITGEYPDEHWCHVLPFPKKMATRSFTYLDLDPADAVSENAPVSVWGKLFNRVFIEDNKLRFPLGLWYEDNPFYYEALVLAERVCFTNERLYYYRVNRRGSIQQSSSNDKRTIDIVSIMRLIYDIFEREKCTHLLKALKKYMVRDFSWRYMAMSDNRRLFLKAVEKTFSQDILNRVHKELIGRGIPASELRRHSSKISKISVIIPTFNNQHTIEECINSVLEQTLSDIDIIIVNDCSTDRTSEILRAITKNNKQITLINNDSNSGPGFSRALALEHVSSEYVFFLDADDLLASPDSLDTLYTACKQNNIHTVGGNILCIYDDINDTEQFQASYFEKSGFMRYSDYLPHPTWGFTRFLYSYDLILANRISFPKTRYYEDPLFLTRYMSVARNFWTVTQPVYLYRQSFIKRSLGISQYRELFINISEVLANLKAISWEQYYSEYRTFITFCHGVLDYLESHSEESEEVCKLANSVFSSIDFSNSDRYLTKSEIYKSFSELAWKENSHFKRNLSGALDNTLENTNKQDIRGDTMRNSSLRRIVKNMLRPFFQLYRKAILKAISPALNELQMGVGLDTSHMVWKTQAELSSLVESSQTDVVSLIEKTRTDIENLNTDMVSLIEKNRTDIANDIANLTNKIENDLIFQRYITLLQDARKKIFLIGTPDYGNIGDATITLGTYAFIRKYFSDYALFEITGYKMKHLYQCVQTTIGEGDIIMLQGGGNLGDMYMDEESIRRRVIPDFPNNKIVILPQTIFFSDTVSGKYELETSKDIYGSHKDLTIFLRGNESLEFAKEHFSNARCYSTIDMAHMLSYDFGFSRSGVLMCIRDLSEESGLDEESYSLIIETAKSHGKCNFISHQLPDISEIERGLFVMEAIKQYASAKVVVTDRLHGMIFSIITGTPCVVLSAQTQKIREYVPFFEHSNAVFFIDRDLSKLDDSIKSALYVKEPEYRIDTIKAFDEMNGIIRDLHKE